MPRLQDEFREMLEEHFDREEQLRSDFQREIYGDAVDAEDEPEED